MKNAFKFGLAILAILMVCVVPATAFGTLSNFGGDAIFATVVTAPAISLSNYQGRYERKLFATLMNGLEVFQDINVKRNVKTKLQLTKLEVGDGVRPYAGGLEQLEGEDLKYSGTTLEAHLFQRDFSVEIKKYYQSWLEEQLRPEEGSSSKQKTIPFAEWTTKKILEKLKSELNDKTAYFGFDKSDATAFAAGSTYSEGDRITFTENGVVNYYRALESTTAGQSPTTHPAKWQKENAEAVTPGFGAIIAKLIDDSKVSETAIGKIDNDSVMAYAAHTELFRAHADAYQKYGAVHFCSYDQFHLLLDDLETSLTKYTEKDGMWVGRGLVLPKTNRKCIVLPCTWMAGTERIISTPRENLLGATDLLSDMNTMVTRQATNYVTVTSITGTIGFGIQDPKALVINDQD